MNFVIYIADCTGNKANCDYPHRVEVDSSDVLQEAVKKDHVCAEYKDNYRNKDNFVTSNAIVMDVDNDHTDEPSEFITEAMPSVVVVGRRHNLTSHLQKKMQSNS